MTEYIVIGSREGANYRIVREKLDSLNDIECIISGGARGTDMHAKLYAKRNNIRYIEFPADWDSHGKRAGYIRNLEMATAHPNAKVLAFWNGSSRGTAHWFRFDIEVEVIQL